MTTFADVRDYLSRLEHETSADLLANAEGWASCQAYCDELEQKLSCAEDWLATTCKGWDKARVQREIDLIWEAKYGKRVAS